MNLSLPGLVIGSALLATCGPVQAEAVLAGCPSRLAARGTLPAGARLLGKIATATASLKAASVTDQAPRDVRADGQYLAEIETESIEDGDMNNALAWFSSTANSVSLVCVYGAGWKPSPKTAVLLVPLPQNEQGECTIRTPLQLPGEKAPRIAATAACVRKSVPKDS